MSRRGAFMGIIKEIRRIISKKCICTKCGELKNPDEFYHTRRKANKHQLHRAGECKVCSLKDRKKHYTENRDKILAHKRFSNYGISKDEYFQMLDNQDGVCAICKREERTRDSSSNNLRSLAVDHCHDTGNVRGLLCRACNLALGFFEDNPKFLTTAIQYLEDTVEPQIYPRNDIPL
jgi:hypothetical protein